MRSKLLIVALLMMLVLIAPAMAWGASSNVAAVDDEPSLNNGWVYSQDMGYVYYANYPSVTMTTVQPANVNAATLSNYDTLFLFACNPAVFTAQQKTDIVNFVKGGGKLIIWDSEDPYPNVWDYSWLPTPFSTSVPGAMGAHGTLYIDEENELSSVDSLDPYYIDNYTLSVGTDAVGDANVFTGFIPQQWCVDCSATNVLQITGPTHVYTDSSTGLVGNGIVIYNGLDWDAAGYYTGYPTGNNGDWLKKMLKQEFEANTLPCGAPPPTNLDVTKVSDKTDYNIGDTIIFTVNVTNPSTNPYTAVNVVLTDYPPAQVLLSQTVYNLGNLAPGQSVEQVITGMAVASGCPVTNSVNAIGYYGTFPVFTGGDTVTFNIECINGPEFPSLMVPASMIIGLLAVISYLRRKED